MTDISQVDLSSASHIYAVANTPLFLLRKLREDQTVHEIAAFDGDLILDELKSAMSKQPLELGDYVKPYVFLVALSLKGDDSYLKKAGQLVTETQHWIWDWFDYSWRALLETYKPTVSQSMEMPKQERIAIQTTETHTPVEHQVLYIPS